MIMSDKNEQLNGEELESVAGGWIPESNLGKANEIAKEIAAFFHSVNIPDNSRETVKKYVEMCYYYPIVLPSGRSSDKGIGGLYYPLSNFTITKDDVIDLVMKYI